MFKFSTNTIINSLEFPSFGNVPTTNTGGKTIVEHPRFWVDTKIIDDPILRIAKHFEFHKKNVVHIYKRVWENPQLFLATFDLQKVIDAFTASKEAKGVGRIEIYVRLSGSQNSYYSNDFVFKGKPFFIEFPIKTGDTPAILAKKIARIAKKYQNMVYEYPLLNVFPSDDKGVAADDGAYITVGGTDEYQVIKKAELQFYNEASQSYDCCANFGAFELEADGVVVKQGHEGFGTYRQIMKDLRLPTAANTRWTAIAKDDMPIFGGHYNEYIIKMCVNRGIMGGDAVGEVVKSLTTHVFYVLDNGCADSIITAWENALSFAFGTDLIETVDKDYDDVSLTKDQIDTSAENAKKLVAAETDAHATNLVDTTKNFTPKGIKEGDRQPATAATPNP